MSAQPDSGDVQYFLAAMQSLAGSGPTRASRPRFVGDGSLDSVFPVTALASAAMATASMALADTIHQRFGTRPAVSVDRRLASFWFGTSLRPQGWALPSVRDPVTGDYRTRDGWIRLHCNAPHHRRAAVSCLGVEERHDAVARAIAGWDAHDLQEAIVAAGGCAARMLDEQAWRRHPQGMALAAEPLFTRLPGAPGRTETAPASASRPLAGIKVLDLTRVLAGPVATRFLAAYGADVLRIDPPTWTEPGMVPEVTLGKRCAELDLRRPEHAERFRSLLSEADVLVHGYRADALDRMGLGDEQRQAIRPGLVDVRLNAYGWTGPWANRRGFDSLVQMSCGIAETGMRRYGRDRPTPLPVQALDQATGYLLAAAVLCGLTQRLQDGQGSRWRLSLAATAHLLMSRRAEPGSSLAAESEADWNTRVENTFWGPSRRLLPAWQVEGAPARWDRPATALRTSPAQW